MPTSGELAKARYHQVQSVTSGTVTAVQGLWRDVTPNRILSAMQGTTGRQILSAVIAGQLSVASGAQAFVSGAMMAQGAGWGPLGSLIPGALAGIAQDGRPLASLLFLPAISTANALALGMTEESAALYGLNQMARMVATTVADTSRSATSVSMAAEPKCISYVRVVKLPACSRCILLAGRQYSYSTGFKRHPKCDCGMEPLSDADWRSSAGPEDLVKQMTPEERQQAFGKDGAKAIEAGADVNQVVNARRGMTTTTSGKSITREGTTRRGIGGKALNSGFEKKDGSRVQRSRQARLMPEQIFRQTEDRELQLALLRKHGYIT